MAKHTKRRAAEKQRRGKGSRKYGGKVKNTDGTVVSGVRGTIANALIDEGLNKMSVDKKVLLFNTGCSLPSSIKVPCCLFFSTHITNSSCPA